MADRYWVPGSSDWNSSSSWASTLGGAGYAGVPTSADNVFFGNNISLPAVVYISAAASCLNFNFDGGNPTSVGSLQISLSASLTIAGTFSTSNTAGNRRMLLSGAFYQNGTQFTPVYSRLSIAAVGTVSDVDFENIYLTGAVTSFSGTRLGNLGRNVGIVFDAPKNVYWVGGTNDWSNSGGWAATSGGTASTDYFPLCQDTAIIDDNSGAAGITLTLANNTPYFGNFDSTARTSSFTFDITTSYLTYFDVRFTGDIKLGSGVTLNSSSVGSGKLLSSGGGTSNILSNGRSFFPNRSLYVVSGTLKLADAFSQSSTSLALMVQGGTFDTNGYNFTYGGITTATGYTPKSMYLRSSTVTLTGTSPVILSSETYSYTDTTPNSIGLALTFDAGTSSIICTSTSGLTFTTGNRTFYDVSFTGNILPNYNTTVSGGGTFRNLTCNSTSSSGTRYLLFPSPVTVTDTLTVGTSVASSRLFIAPSSTTIGRGVSTAALTVGTLVSTNCDFEDVTLSGTASGTSVTRGGDFGGNSGITFPSPKTVYWNLAGSQNFFSVGWATSSGGTPDVNNFPLAQDTAVFDNTGAAGTVTMSAAYRCGSAINASARTSAMTFAFGTSFFYMHGDLTLGTGVTVTNASFISVYFVSRGTQTITTNGVSIPATVVISAGAGVRNAYKTQLGGALTITGTSSSLTIESGIFDAVSYNVTSTSVKDNVTATARTLKMGSGTWTVTGTGTVWNFNEGNVNLDSGTSTIVLSSTSTTARTFNGGSYTYNKLVIGGITGISTLTISGNNFFKEFSSSKIVGHTIALGTTTQFFGKWLVTGTFGNVVTLTGTGTGHVMQGACTSGIDYLAMGSIGFSSGSMGEFYAGANSTGTAGAPVYRTAKPADSVRYWVGGTGNWNLTANWSTSSGGAGGASIPRSHDDVVFDSASSASSYTATVGTVTGGIRCKKLTIGAPASGIITFAGTASLYIHNDVNIASTVNRTYSGNIALSGSTTGRVFNTNGVILASSLFVWGDGCSWSFGSNVNIGAGVLTLYTGSLDFSTYDFTGTRITNVNTSPYRTWPSTLSLGSGTITLTSATPWSIYGTWAGTSTVDIPTTINAGGSAITMSSSAVTSFIGGGKTYNNVSFTSTTSISTLALTGANTFNSLTFAGLSVIGLRQITTDSNFTVNGTLTFGAAAGGNARQLLTSTITTTSRTVTVNAFSGTDVDFRDISVTGAGAPISGTRLGNAGNNSGITFPAPKTVYRVGSGAWTNPAWATSSGGATSANNFPLAQDTAIIDNASLSSGGTITFSTYPSNVGTIDTSAHTGTVYFTVATDIWVCGNINLNTSTQISVSPPSVRIFLSGTGSQTLTTNGNTVFARLIVYSKGGTVSLSDALTISNTTSTFSTAALEVQVGTFNTNGYNVTFVNGGVYCGGTSTFTRAINAGTTTWTLKAQYAWYHGYSRNFTYTGSGIFKVTSSVSNSYFYGGDTPNMTLNLAGTGILLNFNGAKLYDITSDKLGSRVLGQYASAFSPTVARLTKFSAAGTTTGYEFYLMGASPYYAGSVILENSGPVNTRDLNLSNMVLSPTSNTWYINTDSTWATSYGFVLGTPSTGNFLLFFVP